MMTVEEILTGLTHNWKKALLAVGALSIGATLLWKSFPRNKAAPDCVIIISGKRKSGKDYLTGALSERIGTYSSVVRLSAPLKRQFAIDHNLDFEELLKSSEYKEKYRFDMIKWGEEKRAADPGYFCRLATEGQTARVWIVSDARRKTDIEYFQKRYNTYTLRVSSTESVREQRGWRFTSGVDDAESECGLDDTEFDHVVENNSLEGITPALDRELQKVIVHAMTLVSRR
eukprot:m.183299 g.183299  ORF g.183299 m.183299 type:complete len:230 (+) comp13592_c0_seq21:81-770(+)